MRRRLRRKDHGVERGHSFLLKLVAALILLPFRFIGVFIGRSTWKQVIEPITLCKEFVTSAKTTFWIIIITALVSIIAWNVPESFFYTFAMQPSDLLTGRWFTFVTAGLLHANAGHLLGNLIGIFLFGRVVEKNIGAKWTFISYLVALFFAGLSSAAVDLFVGTTGYGVGASGGLMGLIAIAILLEPLYLSLELGIPIPIVILGWLAVYADIVGILSGQPDGIGHFAHLGGFIWMSLLTYWFYKENRMKLRKGLAVNLITVVVGVLVALSMAL